jgi:hypothetical protein
LPKASISKLPKNLHVNDSLAFTLYVLFTYLES